MVGAPEEQGVEPKSLKKEEMLKSVLVVGRWFLGVGICRYGVNPLLFSGCLAELCGVCTDGIQEENCWMFGSGVLLGLGTNKFCLMSFDRCLYF